MSSQPISEGQVTASGLQPIQCLISAAAPTLGHGQAFKSAADADGMPMGVQETLVEPCNVYKMVPDQTKAGGMARPRLEHGSAAHCHMFPCLSLKWCCWL